MIELATMSPAEAWRVHEWPLPRVGKRAVGVARQRVPPGGRQTNCQLVVAVSKARDLDDTTRDAGHWWPLAWALYLPRDWARDRARREAARVPAERQYLARWEIAIELIAGSLREPGAGHSPVVVADATYGRVLAFRTMLTNLGTPYVLEVPPLMLARPACRGLPAARAAEQLALGMRPVAAVHRLESWYLAWRVRPAAPSDGVALLRPEEWLLAEWRDHGDRASRFWLSSLGEDTAVDELVRLATGGDGVDDASFGEKLARVLEDAGAALHWDGFHCGLAAALAAAGKGMRTAIAPVVTRPSGSPPGRIRPG